MKNKSALFLLLTGGLLFLALYAEAADLGQFGGGDGRGDTMAEILSQTMDSITVTSPNGGENWNSGTSHNITWTSTGTIANVNIDYSTNSGGSWSPVAANTTNDGTQPWTVPSTPSTTCLVRVSDAANADTLDTSDAVFTIATNTTSYTISGTILVGGTPLAGVVMSGLTGNPTTNASGFYSGTVTSGWSGTVTPTLIGYTFTPATRTYANVIANSTGQNYTATVVSIQRLDFIGTWDGQGVYYRNSLTSLWVKLATPATLVTAGDLDGDGIDDLIGIWPGQGGVWVKYSQSGNWAQLSSTARDISAGDMNGDGRDDLVATWDGQGVYYRHSLSGAWVKMATPATQVTAGDLDGDGKDDVIGIWPSQGGVWVKYSQSGSWAQLSSTAIDIAAGDMNGDGRDDLMATWDGQGVYYRNSISGAWVKMATPATLVAAGDLDGDGKADVIGIWPGQGGVWVKYSQSGSWA